MKPKYMHAVVLNWGEYKLSRNFDGKILRITRVILMLKRRPPPRSKLYRAYPTEFKGKDGFHCNASIVIKE